MIEQTIKEALYYAKCHLGLRDEDAIYLENLLLQHFSCPLPYDGAIDEKAIEGYAVPDKIVGDIVSYLVNEKGVEEGEAERTSTWVMGMLSPLPSVVDDTFRKLYRSSPKKATDYLYDLSIKNDYIAKSKVDKNILWNATYPDGTPVAMVAFWNEYGTKRIPPRPFFRTTVSEQKKNWVLSVQNLMKMHNDPKQVMGLIGVAMSEQIKDSIKTLSSPKNSDVTLLLKNRFPMGGYKYGDYMKAIGDAQKGISAEGGNNNPLIWSGKMLRSISFEVGEGD